MTEAQAKQVLLLHRPGLEATDPELAEALVLMRENAELRAWFEEHCAFQTAMRRKFQELEVPAEGKARIEAAHKILRLRSPWPRALWSAAAAAVILIGLILAGAFNQRKAPDRFADYRSRMVRMAVREYHMDIVTNDLTQVRNYQKTHGAPADYSLTGGLERLQLTGGGAVRWRGHPVSMVCFDRGDRQMLFLFVMEGTSVPGAPAANPELAQVNKLVTASWSRDNKTYVLAGPADSDLLRNYF